MKKEYKFIIVIIVLISLFYLYSKQSRGDDNFLKDYSTKYANNKDFVLAGGSYEEYKIEKLSFADTGKVILFFNASWCPSCSDFKEELEKVELPDDVLLLDVDYDNSEELRKKYEVALQHTFVQVDSEGGVIKKWSGGGVNKLKQELNLSSQN